MVHFELAGPDETMSATGNDFTHTADLGNWDNHGSVVRLPHDRGLAARREQWLTMWTEDEPAR